MLFVIKNLAMLHTVCRVIFVIQVIPRRSNFILVGTLLMFSSFFSCSTFNLVYSCFGYRHVIIAMYLQNITQLHNDNNSTADLPLVHRIKLNFT